MPYRAGKRGRRPAAGTGLVADMVRQFADRYAFVRELVQNGIDAGAHAIEVAVAHRPDGMAVVSVTDDGHGMSRAIIEGPLLTLFTSEKEGDATKIGKYGVGFVSIFAIDPDRVVVESSDGAARHRLTLAPDHTYELSELEPERRGATPRGTVVSIELAMSSERYADHARRTREALVRWCRHAHVPIVFREGVDESLRVDRPLDVEATHRVRVDHDGATIVVGAGGSDRFGGFYHRGLTLYETTAGPDWLEGLRFKIDSPALQHTLSRDDVRHDDAYHAAMRALRVVVETTLRAELLERLRQSAAHGSRDHDALLAAALAPSLKVEARDLALPLASPVRGRTACRGSDLLREGLALRATDRDALTDALAKVGRPVWRTSDGGLAIRVGDLLGAPVVAAGDAFVLVVEAAGTASDRALLDAVSAQLDAAQARVPTARLITLDGADPGVAGVALGNEPLVSLEGARRGWLGWLRTQPLGLNTAHPAVESARSLATRDPWRAAALLTRYLLVEQRGAITASVNDALLAAAARGRP